jgi:hypothetical protein
LYSSYFDFTLPYDPFWVQVREAVHQRAGQWDLKLIPIEIEGRPHKLRVEEQSSVLEELLAQQLDALICWSFRKEPSIKFWRAGFQSFTSPGGIFDTHYLSRRKDCTKPGE